MFLMDSLNAGRRNTRHALGFIKTLINELDIENDNIHVGLMSAECEEDVAGAGFGLGAHASKLEFEKTIDTMKGTDFHEIIHKMRRHAFRTSRGARKHAKKIAILIIDGSLEEPLKTLTEAQRAKIHGVEVYVVQVITEFPFNVNLGFLFVRRSKARLSVSSYLLLRNLPSAFFLIF